MRRGFTAAFTVLTLLVVLVTPAAADGIVVPRDPAAPPLTTKYHHVQVHIVDQVASTHVDQVFVNEWNRECEGTYLFPIPESAAISDFTLEADGQTLGGRLLDRDEARRTYEAITGQHRDPALLEYVGRDAFQASVYPIPPHGQRRIQIGYSEVLRADGDTIYYRYPLNTEKFSRWSVEDVSVTVCVEASRDIQAIYSPSHDVAVHRVDARTVEVSYEVQDETPYKDFELYYVLGDGTPAASLMTYRDSNEDGFFLLLLAPPPTADGVKILDRDMILVLDTSGSMRGAKLEQAKGALGYILDNLNPGDRFNVVTFDTRVSTYANRLVPASQAPVARRYVDELKAENCTNIDGALDVALRLTDGDSLRPQVVVFLTDGLPTVGEHGAARIVANVKACAPAGLRLFTWGVGYDVNTVLLDTLALEQRGTSDYVLPSEDIECRITSFYRRTQCPILADLALEFHGVETYDLYPPSPLPDLFAGEQIVVAGRFRGRGRAVVTLRGQVDGVPQAYTYRNMPFGTERNRDFIPRLWATRKVGYLMSQIRLHGTDDELVNEITALGIRYGIVTPHTSFLTGEPHEWGVYLRVPETGPDAVAQSQRSKALREADRATWPTVRGICHVGARTFFLLNDVWTDSFYTEDMPVKTIAFGSANYYDILARRPDWGPYFALGRDVIIVEGNEAYRVAEGDHPAITVPAAPAPPAPTPSDRAWDLMEEILRQVQNLLL